MFSYDPKSGDSIFDPNPRRELEQAFMLDAITRKQLSIMSTFNPKPTEVTFES
jgi:hypothetical protein